MNDEAGAGQYHFDPATYLTMMLTEVPAYQDLQRHVAEAAAGISAGSILELGVGTGETASAVLAVHPAARLVGIDENEPMLARARDRFPGTDLRVQRLEDPLPEGNYDLVVSALTVHHLAAIGVVAGVPNMAHAGGRGAAVATSPLSAAVPAGRHEIVLLDMATAVMALGRIAQLKAAGATFA